MTPEHVAASADVLRAAGALDVVVTPTMMKKGRGGQRLEVLCAEADAPRLEDVLFLHTTTLGVRWSTVERHALPRRSCVVQVLDHSVRVKIASLPNGAMRAKPEFDDVRAVSDATGRSVGDVASLALAAAERHR